MADRSVTYEFRAKFDSFRASLAAGGRSVDDFGKKLTGLDAQGAKARQGLAHFGDIGGKIALGATAGLAAIVGVTANFEKAMSGVAAATGEGEAGMNALREAAIQAGAETAFSASEAAAGIENLAKAGVATQDILGGGLQGALDLAAAGGIEVAVAAEAAASAMTQFGLAGEDVPHIADLLAAAAGKAQGEVTDMAAALNQSGLIAAQVGLSIEEATGGLAAFASAGLLGSDAGTSFKTMLGALTPNSAKAKSAMDELGISAYDAQGNFIGLSEFAGELQAGLSGLTDQQRQATLETIFGSDAVRAASILYEQGADGIQTWIDKTNDSGFAAEQAATRLDNLAGDFEALTGSLETALIGAGSGSQGPLRSLVQNLTDVVNAFNDLPGPAQGAVTALLGVTALFGGGLWVTSKVVQGIASTKTALSDLGIQALNTRTALQSLGKVGSIAALAILLPQIQKGIEGVFGSFDIADQSELGRDLETLLNTGDAVGEIENLNSWISILDDNIAQATATSFGWLPFDDTTLQQSEESLKKIDAELANMVESGRGDEAARIMAEIESRAAGLGTSANQLPQIFTEYGQAVENSAAASDDAAGATGDLAGATKGLGGATGRATKSLKELTAAMLNQRAAALSAFDAETQYREALKAARAQAAKNEAGIRGNSDAALANRNALSGLASAWNNQSDAVRNNTAKFREAKSAFIQTAVAMGVPREQARALARELLAIPKSTVAKVNVDSGNSLPVIHGVISALSSVRDKTVHITTVFQRHNISADRLNRAGGGLVTGPGGPTDDLIPAMVSNREYVVQAAAVEKYGVEFFDRANAMRLAEGGMAGRTLAVPTAPSGHSRTNVAVNLSGMTVTGVLKTPWGPAEIEGIVDRKIEAAELMSAEIERAG